MNLPSKTRHGDIALVYCTGVVQGLALVTFPAASSIFTSPSGYGFTTSRYGAMFVPQVLFAILASSLAPKFARRWGLKRVLVLGLAGNVVSMSLLALSKLFVASSGFAFSVLLISTGALGLGFGATVMALNTYAEELSPGNANRAVLALNALLGAGTALAPLFVAIFVGLGVWWMLPLTVAMALALILAITLRQPLQVSQAAGKIGGNDSLSPSFGKLPGRLWLYAAAVLLYGVVETLNGNWATLYLSQERGVSAQGASFALTAFWAMVTAGRLLFAAISSKVPVRWIYGGLPILALVAFQSASRVSGEVEGILAFGLSGLACSAFLPLSLSFGASEFPRLSAVISGELIAFYQAGYGIAAFGVGPLRGFAGLQFSAVLAWGSLVAGAMGAIAILIVRRS